MPERQNRFGPARAPSSIPTRYPYQQSQQITAPYLQSQQILAPVSPCYPPQPYSTDQAASPVPSPTRPQEESANNVYSNQFVNIADL